MFIAVILCTCIGGEVYGHIKMVEPNRIEDEPARVANQATEMNAVILIPIDWEDFRLVAQRAVFVDWKNHPYLGTEVMEWWRRIQVVQQFYDPSTSADDRKRICNNEAVNYYILPTSSMKASEIVVAKSEPYAIVRCGA